MKFDIVLSRAVALVSLIASVEAAHGHGHHAKHHHRDVHSIEEVGKTLQKKGSQCQFPSDAGLVSVTPNSMNGGWAMSPNQPCKPGNYCPYACPPGQVSMQWDPKATSYSYPMSMNGGLYCDEDGEIQKPFPDRPYCQDGVGSVNALNKASQFVSFCQTVLPGNEAMLIPTLVEELATLAVPDTNYWCETAAHFYINPPGIDAETACVWGTSSNPYGNWSPFVAGANTDSEGNTYVKVGWNPIYLEPTTPFRDVVPDFGVEIICEGDSCDGLPCSIDPAVNGVNEMTGSSTDGAGGASFCVVTVPPGEKAHVVVFDKTGGDSSSTSVAVPTSSVASSSTQTPSSTSTSTTSSIVSTSTPTPTSTSTSSSTSSTATPSSSSSSSSSSVQTPTITPSSTFTPSSSGLVKSSKWLSVSVSASYTYQPHVFLETGTAQADAMATSGPSSGSSSDSGSAASASSTSSNAGSATAAVSILSMALSAFVATMMLGL